MSGNHITEMLVDLLYNELAPDKKRKALEHLASCPLCAREFEELKATRGAFANLADPEPPAFLNTRIMAHAREARKPKSALSFLMRPSYAAAAVAVLALTVGIVVMKERGGASGKDQIAMAPSAGKSMDRRARDESFDLLGLTGTREADTSEKSVIYVLDAGSVFAMIEAGSTMDGSTTMIALGGATAGMGDTAMIALGGSTLGAGDTAMLALNEALAGSTAAGSTVSPDAGSTIMSVAMAPPPPTMEVAKVAPDLLLDEGRYDKYAAAPAAPEARPYEAAPAPEPGRGFEDLEDGKTKPKEEKAGFGWLESETKPAPAAGEAAAPTDDADAGKVLALNKKDATASAPKSEAPAATAGPSEKAAPPKAATRSAAPEKSAPAPSRGAGQPIAQPSKPQAAAPSAEFIDLLNRAERTKRTLGSRLALPAYERALALAGYNKPADGSPIPPPGKCSPELERAIKGALDCYYDLGRAQDAIPLEKWRAATCSPQ